MVRHLALNGSRGGRTGLTNESAIGVNGERAIQCAVESQLAAEVDAVRPELLFDLRNRARRNQQSLKFGRIGRSQFDMEIRSWLFY